MCAYECERVRECVVIYVNMSVREGDTVCVSACVCVRVCKRVRRSHFTPQTFVWKFTKQKKLHFWLPKLGIIFAQEC